ncbi:MAG: hypothetical protein V1663_01430 [archaeon]
MNKKLIISLLGVIVLVVVVFGIIGIFDSPSATGNVAKTTDTRTDNVKEFKIESFTEIIDEKYYPQFSQKEITVNKGDLVRIKITNIKGTHDFKIDEFNVYAETPLNQEVVLEFVADKAGSFE